MVESKNRFFSKLASNVDSSGDITAEAISPSVSLGITTYDSAKLLPLSGISSGDQALTLDTGRLYLSNGSGWFNIGLANLAPRITSGPTGAEYVLDSAGNPSGGSEISISLTAFDSDGTNVNWSYIASDSAFDLATITNDSNGTFNITSKSLADLLAAGYDSTGGSFSITFRASDGIAFDTDSASFSLTYFVASIIDYTNLNLLDSFTGSSVVSDAGNPQFGKYIHQQGDTLIVGAPSEASDDGAAYIFTTADGGSTWTEQARIESSDGDGTNQNFGSGVAVYNDTAAVSAWRDNGNRGAVYIFTRSGSTWTQQAKLTPSTYTNTYLGGRGALLLDSDGLYIGARGSDVAGNGAGAVYIYTGSGSSWTLQTTLTDASGSDNEGFGNKIDKWGGYLAVGSNSGYGIVNIYTGGGSTWTLQQRIDLTNGGNIGDDIAIHDDLLITTNPSDNSNSNTFDFGAVYVYRRSGSTWSLEATLRHSGATSEYPYFGTVVEADTDTVLCGILSYSGVNDGAIEIYQYDGSSWSLSNTLRPSTIEDYDEFGGYLSENNIFIGDNNKIYVGARGDNSYDGRVYVFGTQ